jgi:proline racemase
VAVGNRIVAAAKQQLTVSHPENPDIQGVTFAEFAMPFAGPDTVSRNAVIVAPGRIDRSPCGTGTSARLAVLHARGQLGPGQGFIHESIIGSRFDATIAAEVEVGGRPGIVPTIAGQAWITGVFQHGVDPSDPFRHGFTLPDMWFA